MKRLEQINRQQQNVRLFTNEDVQKTLKLTDEQKDKLKIDRRATSKKR